MLLLVCNFNFIVQYLAKDKGEKKLFGFAFTPLMRDDGTTLSDDIHELYVYKVTDYSFVHLLEMTLHVCGILTTTIQIQSLAMALPKITDQNLNLMHTPRNVLLMPSTILRI